MKTNAAILVACCVILTMCASKPITTEDCEAKISNALRCINEYYFTMQTSHLDSALVYLNQVEGRCEKYEDVIALDKVHIYVLLCDYAKALKILSDLNSTAFPFAEFKEIMIDKVKIKEAMAEDNARLLTLYYRDIVDQYTQYLHRTKPQLDSILRLPDLQSIVNTQSDVAMSEMYIYKARSENIEQVLAEIDTLQKAINGNPAYFDRLRSIVKGEIKVDILLE